MPTVAYLTHPVCRLHDMGPHHPESPARLAAIQSLFEQSGLMAQLLQLEARAADDRLIAKAHPQQLIDELRELSPEQGMVAIDGDTAMNPYSLQAAIHAVGAGTQAVDGVLAGQFQRAFCAVRPPGHHAEANLPMGFCIFNSIAVAALHALEQPGIERVAIIDFDVHHGNGTVDIFKDDPRVMVCSSFQYPFYPGRMQNIKRDHIINTPLPAHTGSLAYRKAVEQQWLQPLQDFAPHLVLVSAGFDAHREDPLAMLELKDDDYHWLGQFITSIANQHSQGRVVSLLEGGYNLDALARSSYQFVSALVQN